MTLITKYVRSSGSHDGSRMDLLHRESDDGTEVESWVFQVTEKETKSYLRRPGRVSGLWRSDAGRGFAVGENTIYAFRLHTYGWASYDVEWSPRGVYGVDDRNVWVWGTEYGAGAIYRWNGGTSSGNWDEVKSCPGEIRAMHGTSTENLFAVCDGFVARWDGASWSHEAAPAERLCAVSALPDGTAFACGEDGELWERVDEKWHKKLHCKNPLLSIAYWKGKVWVGEDGDLGLCHFQNDELVSKKPNLRTVHLEGRKDLFWVTEGAAGGTEDGEYYFGRRHSDLSLLQAETEITTEISG